MDWLPISAAALVTGATALVIGAQLVPRPDGEGTLLRLAAENPDQWLVLSILLTVAAVGLIIGMPCLFVLFGTKGFRTGLVGTFGLAVGAVLLAGFAQVLVIFRGLALQDVLDEPLIEAVVQDDLLQLMVTSGFLAFYGGELLLALALYRARTVPGWVPWALLVHVAVVPLQGLMPTPSQGLPVVLMAAAFAGAGIAAARRSGQGLAEVPRTG